YGLGHGGVESMVLISGLALTQLLTILSLASGGITSLPPEQRDIATRQLGAIAAQPAWIPLLSLWERVCTLAVHVGLSVLVAQVFIRAALRYLWLAILAHTAVDLLGVGLPQALGPNDSLALPVSFALLTLFGLAGLALARAFKTAPSG
ncbi:MAG: YhfC family intramembrane metalloprotease, partial [Chloroflexi bacterium]|nr:YhfC family intramembrane metalloprotease [Chloroflexota bacterium]